MDDKELKNVLDSIISEIHKLSEKVDKMDENIETIKKDVKRLKKDTIKLQAMDESILDEVERVHVSLIHKGNERKWIFRLHYAQ